MKKTSRVKTALLLFAVFLLLTALSAWFGMFALHGARSDVFTLSNAAGEPTTDSVVLDPSSWTPVTYLNAPDFQFNKTVSLNGNDYTCIGYGLPTTSKEQYSMEASLVSPKLNVADNTYAFRFSCYTRMRAGTPHKISLLTSSDNVEYVVADTVYCTDTEGKFEDMEMSVSGSFYYLKLQITAYYSYDSDEDDTDRGIYFLSSSFCLAAQSEGALDRSYFRISYSKSEFIYNGQAQQPEVTVYSNIYFEKDDYTYTVTSYSSEGSPCDAVHVGNYYALVEVRNRSNAVSFTDRWDFTITKALLSIRKIEYVCNDSCVVVLHIDAADETGRVISEEELDPEYYYTVENGRTVKGVSPILKKPTQDFGIVINNSDFIVPTNTFISSLTGSLGSNPVYYIEKYTVRQYDGTVYKPLDDAVFYSTTDTTVSPDQLSLTREIEYYLSDQNGEEQVSEIKRAGNYRCILRYGETEFEFFVTVLPRPVVAFLYSGNDLVKYYDGTSDLFDQEKDAVVTQLSASDFSCIDDPDFVGEDGFLQNNQISDAVVLQYEQASYARLVGKTYIVLKNPSLTGDDASNYYIHEDFHIVSSVRLDSSVFIKTDDVFVAPAESYYLNGKNYVTATFSGKTISEEAGMEIEGTYYEYKKNVSGQDTYAPTSDGTFISDKTYYTLLSEEVLKNNSIAILPTQLMLKSDRDEEGEIITCPTKTYTPNDTSAENVDSDVALPCYGNEERPITYRQIKFVFSDCNVGDRRLYMQLRDLTLLDRYQMDILTPTALHGAIVPRPLTIRADEARSFVENVTKTYDGTTDAHPVFTDLVLETTPDGFPAFSDYVISYRNASYVLPDAGDDIELTIYDIALTGLTATAINFLKNYSFEDLQLVGDIEKKKLEVYTESLRVYERFTPTIRSNAESEADLRKRVFLTEAFAESEFSPIPFSSTTVGQYVLRIDLQTENYYLPDPGYVLIPMNVISTKKARQKIVFSDLDISSGTSFLLLADSVLSLSAYSVDEESRLSTGLTVACQVDDPNGCLTSSGGSWIAKKPGAFRLTFTQQGNNYFFAADPVVLTFTIVARSVTGTSSLEGLYGGNALPELVSDARCSEKNTQSLPDASLSVESCDCNVFITVKSGGDVASSDDMAKMPSEFFQYFDYIASYDLYTYDVAQALFVDANIAQRSDYILADGAIISLSESSDLIFRAPYSAAETPEQSGLGGYYECRKIFGKSEGHENKIIPEKKYYSYSEVAVPKTADLNTYYEYASGYVRAQASDVTLYSDRKYYAIAEVTEPTVENIHTYLEYADGYYTATSDLSLSAGKTYYVAVLLTDEETERLDAKDFSSFYEYATLFLPTQDVAVVENKIYITISPVTTPVVYNLSRYIEAYEEYFLTEDIEIDGAKTYYEKTRSHEDYLTVISRLFGFDNVAAFRSYVDSLAEYYKTNPLNATENDRLVYAGAVYASDGSVVLPYVFESDLAENVLAVLKVNAEGKASIWLSDVDEAFKAVNFDNIAYLYPKKIEIYGRCSLFDEPDYMLSYNGGIPSGTLVPAEDVLSPDKDTYKYYFSADPVVGSFDADFSIRTAGTYYIKSGETYQKYSGDYSTYDKYYIPKYTLVSVSALIGQAVPKATYYENVFVRTVDRSVQDGKTYYAAEYRADSTIKRGDIIPAGMYYEKKEGSYSQTQDTFFNAGKTYYLASYIEAVVTPGAARNNRAYYERRQDGSEFVYFLTADTAFDGEKTYYVLEYSEAEVEYNYAIPSGAIYYERSADLYLPTEDVVFLNGKIYYHVVYVDAHLVVDEPISDAETYYEIDALSFRLTYDNVFEDNKNYYLLDYEPVYFIAAGDLADPTLYKEKSDDGSSYLAITAGDVFVNGKSYVLSIWTEMEASSYIPGDPIPAGTYEKSPTTYDEVTEETFIAGKTYYIRQYSLLNLENGDSLAGAYEYDHDTGSYVLTSDTVYASASGKKYYTFTYVVAYTEADRPLSGRTYYQKDADQYALIPEGRYFEENKVYYSLEYVDVSFLSSGSLPEGEYYRTIPTYSLAEDAYFRRDTLYYTVTYLPADVPMGEHIVGDYYVQKTADSYVLTDDRYFSKEKTYYVAVFNAEDTLQTRLIDNYDSYYFLVEETDYQAGKDYYYFDGKKMALDTAVEVGYPITGTRYTLVTDPEFAQGTTYYHIDYLFLGQAPVYFTFSVAKPVVTLYMSENTFSLYGEEPDPIDLIEKVTVFDGTERILPFEEWTNRADLLDLVTLDFMTASAENEISPFDFTTIPSGRTLTFETDQRESYSEETLFLKLTATENDLYDFRLASGVITHTVKKNRIYIRLTDREKFYGEGVPSDETILQNLTIEGYPEQSIAELIASYSVSVQAYTYSDCGEYPILMTSELDLQQNYDVEYIPGYLVVNPIPLLVGATSEGHDYGKKVAEITTVVSASSTQLTEEELARLKEEIIDDIETYCEGRSSTSDSGEYPITIIYKGTNKNVIVTTRKDCYYPVHYGQLSTQSFQFNDADVLYDGTLHTITVSYNKTLWPNVTITYDKTSFAEIGNYKYTATVSMKNYEDLVLTAVMSICTLTVRSSNQVTNAVSVEITDPTCYNGVNGNYSIVLRPVTDENKIENVSSLIANTETGKYTLKNVYSVVTFLNDTETSLGYSSYTLTINPTGMKYQKNLALYGYSRGQFRKLDYTYQNGAYTFTVSSNVDENADLDPLSYFAFIEMQEEQKESVQYKWVFIVIIGVIILAILGIIAATFGKAGKIRGRSNRRHRKWM